MHKLKIIELRAELEKRGMDSQGTRAELCDRLKSVVDDEPHVDDVSHPATADRVDVCTDDVTAHDSVSQTSRSSTSTSTVRLRLAEESAKRAELEVKLKLMKEKQRVKREAAKLQEETEFLETTEALQVSKVR